MNGQPFRERGWRILLLVATGLPIFLGCSYQNRSYRLASGASGTLYGRTGDALSRLWEQQVGVCINNGTDSLSDPVANCLKLATGEVDFALVADDAPLDQCIDPDDPERRVRIRAIAPLFPEVLFLLHHPSVQASSVAELVSNRKVMVGPLGSHSARFVRKVLTEFAGGSRSFTPVFGATDTFRLSGQVPVVALLASINDPRIAELLRQGGQVFSLDTPERFGKGSRVEGYAARYIHAHPYLLPAGILRSQPTAPVLTLAVDILLATREDLPEEMVYDLTERLFESQQDLVNTDPLFYALSESFDRRTLEFPLHLGAQRYFERHNPTFLERYAEVIALLVTLAVMLYGGFAGVSRWLQKRRKERIDAYYLRVLDIERRGREATSAQVLEDLIEELLRIKEEAIERLIEEKLAADDSFRIFESLAANNLTTLRYRKERIATAG